MGDLDIDTCEECGGIREGDPYILNMLEVAYDCECEHDDDDVGLVLVDSNQGDTVAEEGFDV